MWDYERNGETISLDPTGPLVVRIGGAADLAVQAAVDGLGIIHLFEDWIRKRSIGTGARTLVAKFLRPFLYYPGRRYLPSPLRAFVDFIKASGNL
ncbi:DNA-binding transcriptional LysR family regulator [Pseudomonas frederiksbergensis]